MFIFVIFIFGAVILGAGAMLSPAWPTAQPRVGLAATLALALVVGGTIFYASLFAWETLVIDYLMFALLTGIFLGGTLSVGQTRAEAHGEELLDEDQGWPGPQDLSVLAMMAVIITLPVMLLQVPLGNDAQPYSYMALAMQQGETLNTLAPFQPEIDYLYAPGFNALTAYLGNQLNASLPTVQFSVATVLAFLNVWLAYDFGGEMRDKRLGRAMGLAMFAGLGLLGMLVSGQFTALMGLAFAQAFFIYALRYTRHGFTIDLIAAGLMMGATLIAHAGSFIVLLLGFVAWLISLWMAQPIVDRQRWIISIIVIPLVAAIATAPWTLDNWDLLTAGLSSPFGRDIDHITVLATHNGLWLLPVALLGAWISWQQRERVGIFCTIWLVLIFDFAVTGGVASLFPFITRYLDPRDLAWHGPVIPLALLGGIALLWAWDTLIAPRITYRMTYQHTYAISGVGVAIGLGMMALNPALADILPGDTTASPADIRAMDWIRENSDPTVRVLNYPEGNLWAIGITERPTVYVPQLPYARQSAQNAPADALMAFWDDPAAPINADLLAEYEITMVFVPEQWPHRAIAQATYLTLIYDDGAQVYLFDGASLYEEEDEDIEPS
jgi:uncharacterized membrane protein YiaA